LFEVSGYRIFASYEPPPSTLARMTLDKTELLFSYHTLTLSFGLLVDLHSAINTLWSIKNGSFYMKKLLLTVIFISGCSSIASKDLGNAGTPQATFGCTEESFQTSVARIFTDVLQCKTQLLANPSAPGNRNRLTTSPPLLLENGSKVIEITIQSSYVTSDGFGYSQTNIDDYPLFKITLETQANCPTAYTLASKAYSTNEGWRLIKGIISNPEYAKLACN